MRMPAESREKLDRVLGFVAGVGGLAALTSANGECIAVANHVEQGDPILTALQIACVFHPALARPGSDDCAAHLLRFDVNPDVVLLVQSPTPDLEPAWSARADRALPLLRAAFRIAEPGPVGPPRGGPSGNPAGAAVFVQSRPRTPHRG